MRSLPHPETMHDDLIRMLLDDAPGSTERRRAWIRAQDPELARLAYAWDRFEDDLRRRAAAAVPPPDVLVPLALERAGRQDLLSDAESWRLHDGRAEAERTLRSMPALGPVLERIAADAEAFDREWERAFEEAGSRRDRPPLDRRRPRRILSRALSAAAVLGFAAVTILVARRDSGMNRVSADVGTRVVRLADGSTVRLQPGSTLFHGDAERRVRLEGRAWFDVVGGGSEFRVETRTAVTTVLGTRFAVRAGPEGTEVVLMSGRVAVHPVGRPDHMVVLAPGERTIVAGDDTAPRPTPVGADDPLEWTGMLLFRATPMREVARRLAVAYGTAVAVDPNLADEPVTGAFEPDRPVVEVVTILAEALGATVEIEASGGLRIGVSRQE